MYFQPGLKALVKFQKDRPKTIGVARHGAYSLYSSVVLGSKMPKLKIRKRAKKNNFRIMKNTCIFKILVKFQKDRPKTVGEVAGTSCILPIHFYSTKALKV